MCERWLTHPRVIVRPWTLRMARLLILHPQWKIRIFLFLFFFFFSFFLFQPFAIMPSETVPLFVSFSLRFFFRASSPRFSVYRGKWRYSFSACCAFRFCLLSRRSFSDDTGYWESVLRCNPFGHGTPFLSAILRKYEFYPLLFFPVSRPDGRRFCLVCALVGWFGSVWLVRRSFADSYA